MNVRGLIADAHVNLDTLSNLYESAKITIKPEPDAEDQVQVRDFLSMNYQRGFLDTLTGTKNLEAEYGSKKLSIPLVGNDMH